MIRRLFQTALFLLLPCSGLAAERDVVAPTNTILRVMAANLPGNSQTYEPYAARILQGLRPDVVAIQEFRVGGNTTAEFRSFVDTNFGPGFSYFRESAAGYSIPNGVISRYPFRAAGSWYDTNIADRGFAWAQIDVPGEVDLYVVSVHFKASSGDAAVRARQASLVKTLITSNFPANAWVILAGDLNTQARTETAVVTLKTFLSDDQVPADEPGNQNTNEPRNRPYDYVLPSFSFQTNSIPLQIATLTFTNGLVFDSSNFTQLAAVAPVQRGDSHMGQHMAVMKAFRVPHLVTNRVVVPEPLLSITRSNSLRWNTVSGVTYVVESTADFVSWSTAAQVTASSTLVVTNLPRTNPHQFYRVSF